MIDKNGKLFGKINLIDLLILLVLAAVILFIVCRFVAQTQPKDIVDDQPVHLQLLDTEVPNFVWQQLEKGSNVLDFYENKDLGKLLSYETDEAYSYDVNTLGETVPIHNPACSAVTLTIRAEGVLDENGVIINNVRYGLGHTMVIYVGDCKFYAKVCDIAAA